MPFKKGQSGNPGGRPKRAWTWAGLLEKAVNEKLKSGDGRVRDMVAKSLIAEALKGDVVAQKELMNRMDGMPKQDMGVEGDIHIIITEKEE